MHVFPNIPIRVHLCLSVANTPFFQLKPQMHTDKHRFKKGKRGRFVLLLSVSICVYLWLILLSSCSSKPTDLRTLVPSDTLIYLEANDLAAVLQPVVDNKAFELIAKSKPDFSSLKGVQLAVAVTGFETSEEKLTEEHSVGRVKPRFVAIIDTHAWDWQAVKFAETAINRVVIQMLGDDAKLGRSQKSQETGGTYLTWAASDGGLAHALILDGLIFFSNDETAIDKCLSVRRGEIENFGKTGKALPDGPETMAAGYVSTDGVAQLANIVGMKYAGDIGDDADVQSATADILPQLMRGAVTEISWSATRTDAGIVDKYLISTPGETATVLSETLVPSEASPSQIGLLPADTPRATLYNLKNPQIAWRSLLLTSQRITSPEAGRIIGLFASLLFQPYAVNDAETFLSGVGPNILTANFGTEDEQPVVIAEIKDPAAVRRALSPELKKVEPGTPNAGFEIFQSDDGDLAAAFVGKFVIAGDAESVIKCLKESGSDPKSETFKRLAIGSKTAAITVGSNSTLAREIAEVLADIKPAETTSNSFYVTETRFNRNGFERRTTSDFGLIGSIIAQINDQQ